MLLQDDMIYQILLWLPVLSLLRFKRACRSWHALIESSYFIKQHLRLHHYDPSLKDKNHNLIYILTGKDSSITFPLTSIESFEEPNVCLQLNCSDLHGHFPINVLNIVSYNGIICLNLLNRNSEQSICLWNPATKQSRVLPQSPTLNKVLTMVGFGFDVINNDYKVVNLIKSYNPVGKRVEVYSLNKNAWRSITTGFPFSRFIGNPRMPFNNGTCFFWLGYNPRENIGIVCFDFCSEIFRSISFPCADYFQSLRHIKLISVVCDKIACVFKRNDHQKEIWVFNEYGKVNESWAKFYTVDPYATIDRGIPMKWLSTNGKYIYFIRMEQMYRFNVVTKETNCFTFKDIYYSIGMVGFKESLVSVEKRNNVLVCFNEDSGNQK